MIISISVGSGSGKTTLAKHLEEYYMKKRIIPSLLPLDDYFLPFEDKNQQERLYVVNRDVPQAIDFPHLEKQLCLLIEEKEILVPQYNYLTGSREENHHLVSPSPVIIVEGLYASYMKKSFKIFVDADEKVMVNRCLARIKNKERAGTEGEMKDRLEKVVLPAYRQYGFPQKDNCDYTFPGNTSKDTADYIVELKKVTKHLEGNYGL